MTGGQTPVSGAVVGPELVGRQPLHDHLVQGAAAAAGGTGRLVLVAGAPGIGKSSLVAALARHCGAQGHLVLWGTGWDGEGTPAFWPWLEALRGCREGLSDADRATLADQAAELGRLLPELVPGQLEGSGLTPPAETGGAQFRLFDAVWSLLRLLARRRPVLVVLDDLHWADPASLELLRFVAARARGAPVLVVGAYRDVEVGADHPLRAPLAALRGAADFIPLAGLERGAVEELLASVARTPVPPGVVDEVHRRTGGNPFFVRELARLLDAHGDAATVPDAIRDVVSRGLARLPEQCQHVLQVAAVVGQESDVALLAEVTGDGEAGILDQLQPAERARIVEQSAEAAGRIRFVHDLFRETLYATSPRAATAALHARVGRALERRRERGAGVAASELAHHFLSAGPDPADRQRAVRYSVDAATEALAVVAPHQALAHARRAMAALDALDQPDDALRLETTLVLADAERRAGEAAASRSTIERAVALARQRDDAEALARAGLLAQLLGDDYGTGGEATASLLQEAAAALGDQPGPLRARVLAALARHLYHHDRRRAPEAQQLAAAAVEAAEASGDHSALAHALFAHHDTTWQPGTATQRLAIARRMEAVAASVDPELRAEAVLLAAIALLERCDPEAAGELERYSRLAAALGEPRFQYLALTRQVTVATMRGELETAGSVLEEAALLGGAIGEPDVWHVEMRDLWVLRTLQGRRSELEERVRSWPYPVFVAWYAAQTVMAVCERDSGEEATVAGARLAGFDPADEPLHNLWLVQAATVAEAAVALGDQELAARLYAALTPYAGLGVVTAGAVDFYGAVDHYLGLLAGCLGRRADAVDHLHRAVAQHRQLGATPWATRSQQALAALAADPAGAGGQGPAARRQGVFRRDGDWWTIGFGDRQARLPDAKGLHDIRVLLAAPGRTVTAADLLAATSGTDAAAGATLGADEVLDQTARAAYRARLAELDEELADADAGHDLERAARARFERQLLVDELSAALGLGGRARLLGSGAERARKAVTARIRNSLRRMDRVHPALAEHLSASITTGSSCSYLPAEPVEWEL